MFVLVPRRNNRYIRSSLACNSPSLAALGVQLLWDMLNNTLACTDSEFSNRRVVEVDAAAEKAGGCAARAQASAAPPCWFAGVNSRVVLCCHSLLIFLQSKRNGRYDAMVLCVY